MEFDHQITCSFLPEFASKKKTIKIQGQQQETQWEEGCFSHSTLDRALSFLHITLRYQLIFLSCSRASPQLRHPPAPDRAGSILRPIACE
jgi:hypothetical protein